MIERLQPDANLLVRHEECLVSKERQVRRRLLRRTPWKQRVLRVTNCDFLKQTGGPETRPASVGMLERAERPRLYALEISGADEAMPRDFSLSGEHEAHPAPPFASCNDSHRHRGLAF